MHKKLEDSQKVLEGIAVNDLNMVARHADNLIQLSKKAEWLVIKTPQYELFSNEFRRQAENLIRDAKDQNVDACALDYVELTMNCVRCHKHVREVRMTRRDAEMPVLARLPAILPSGGGPRHK
jgi:hypothetical protein